MLTRRFLSVCGAALLFVFAASVSGQENLFEGKTLDDFDFLLENETSRADIFHLERGVLRITAGASAFLVTKKSFLNFVLTMEVCYPTDGFVDSGVTLRLTPPADGRSAPRGLEVQLKSTDLGDLWGCRGLTISGPAERFSSHVEAGTGDAYCRLIRQRVPRKEEWNRLEIRCIEDRVSVRVNGDLVNECGDVERLPGRIGIQTKRYPEGAAPILFRNAVVTDF